MMGFVFKSPSAAPPMLLCPVLVEISRQSTSRLTRGVIWVDVMVMSIENDSKVHLELLLSRDFL